MRSGNVRRGFTLIELLTVVGIVALLISLLVPALGRSRALGKQSVCSSQLQQLGAAMCQYVVENREWIPGSPNTTGWRSYADAQTPGVPTDYKTKYMIPDALKEQRPVTHVYDWATPLMKLMSRQSMRLKDRQVETRKGIFQCPASPQMQAYSDFTGSYQEVPSYLTCVYFMVSVPGGDEHAAFGYNKPESRYLARYRPRVDQVGPPATKVYLADGTRIRYEQMKFDDVMNGYSDYGAWRNRPDNVLQAYRTENLLDLTYRHPGGINALFFDGHVSNLSEPESRQARHWFPSGSNTGKLPNWVTAEEKLIVP